MEWRKKFLFVSLHNFVFDRQECNLSRWHNFSWPAFRTVANFLYETAVADYYWLMKELLLYFRSMLDSSSFLGDFPLLWQLVLAAI